MQLKDAPRVIVWRNAHFGPNPPLRTIMASKDLIMSGACFANGRRTRHNYTAMPPFPYRRIRRLRSLPDGSFPRDNRCRFRYRPLCRPPLLQCGHDGSPTSGTQLPLALGRLWRRRFRCTLSRSPSLALRFGDPLPAGRADLPPSAFPGRGSRCRLCASEHGA